MRDLEAARYAPIAPSANTMRRSANRLVAAELEARWNQALTRVGEVESQDRRARSQREPITALDPAPLATLATDLETVWVAPTTDARLKKRIVRTLIQEVLPTSMQAAEIILLVHWNGGSIANCACRGGGAGNATAPPPTLSRPFAAGLDRQ